MHRVLTTGELKQAARPGMPNTIALFGTQERYDLTKGFPLLTTKKVSLNNIKTELQWFLNGDTNVDYLLTNKNKIWLDDAYRGYQNKLKTEAPESTILTPYSKDVYRELILNDAFFADQYGDLGSTYGFQWRHFAGKVDQIDKVIHSLKNNPFGRRHIVTAWDPTVVEDLTLPPCHPFFQFNVRKGVDKQYKLDCSFYMRSVDTFLGMPYNIASYALLTHYIAAILDYEVGEVILSAGDTHIYDNQLDEVNIILTRDPDRYPLPKLQLSGPFDNVKDYWNDSNTFFHLEAFLADLTLYLKYSVIVVGYESYPELKATLSVGT